MKLAVIFNGQGSHYKDMGLDFYETFDEAKQVIQVAEKITGYPIHSWLSNPKPLAQTKYAQPTITATSLAIYNSIAHHLPAIAFMAGLSLGEYTSLVASGMLTLEQGLRLNKERGYIMGEVCERISQVDPKSMAAVLQVPRDVVESLVSGLEDITIANYNSKQQIIVAGTKVSINQLNSALKDQGYKRTMPLKLEGPFHTPYMSEATKPYQTVLKAVQFNEEDVPVISNTTLKPHTSETVKKTLVKHLTEPVRWSETIDYFVKQGVTHIVQIGPSETLAKMIRRDKIDVKVIVIDSVEDISKLKKLQEANE